MSGQKGKRNQTRAKGHRDDLFCPHLILWPACFHKTMGADMMTSSNGNNFHVTGPLCENSLVTGEFPSQRPVTQSFGVFFDVRLIKRLSKQLDAGDLRRQCPHYDVTLTRSLLAKCYQQQRGLTACVNRQTHRPMTC